MNNLPNQLQQNQYALQTLNPDLQTISYRCHHWKTYFNNDNDFGYLIDAYPDAISRGNLANISREAHQHRDSTWTRRLFLATMIWGYGKVGYGPYRTFQMLSAPDTIAVLQDTFVLVSTGNLVTAYQRFRLPMCGSAFFTKYFYFIGLGSDLSPQPLILDSVVARKFEEALGIDISRFAKVTRNKEGKITAVGYNDSGYEKYIHLMEVWAQLLHCRADSIELFLFNMR